MTDEETYCIWRVLSAASNALFIKKYDNYDCPIEKRRYVKSSWEIIPYIEEKYGIDFNYYMSMTIEELEKIVAECKRDIKG